MEQNKSARFLRQRKFLLVLPALVIPFMTMAFWALGGGRNAENNEETKTSGGLNMELPGANLKDDNAVDKLGYYEKAATDSARLEELIRNDPYLNKQLMTDTLPVQDKSNNLLATGPYNSRNAVTNSEGMYNDPNEAKVYQKLEQLNSVINESSSGTKAKSDSYQPDYTQPAIEPAEVDRLEQMMQSMNSSENNADPELKQLNGMLEKILDIQHPDRLKEKLREKSVQNKNAVFAVSKQSSNMTISLLDTGEIKNQDSENAGFWGLDKQQSASQSQNGIEAFIHESQILVNGAVVKLRLGNDVYINGNLIPKGNFIYGTASLNNERLEISIGSVRDGYSILPVRLEVHDMDGLPGIYIPGAITRDVAKQSTDNALQSVALSSLDPSIGAQAASAGIEAAKSLLSKKVKLIKVQVKAGYKVILRDNNKQQ